MFLAKYLKNKFTIWLNKHLKHCNKYFIQTYSCKNYIYIYVYILILYKNKQDPTLNMLHINNK